MIFYRANFTTLWLNIESNEQLGILDTGYIEDYNGVDGHLTFFHVGSGTPYDVVMVAVPAETPDTPNDYFRGAVALASIPDGEYEVRCRVRDLVGNYTIVGSVASPLGTERILSLAIRIQVGSPIRYAVQVGPLTARGGYSVDVARQPVTVTRARGIELVEAIRQQVLVE